MAAAVFAALAADGMDLQLLALSLPQISKELQIDPVSAGALSTYTMLGMASGGVLGGWLADRIGRVRVVWWSVLVFTAFTGLIALSQTYWQIAILRFLSGLGLAALYSIGTMLAAEYVPTRIRTTVLGTLQGGWSVGYIVAALLSSYLLPSFGWRALFASAIVPGVVTLMLLWKIPDPPSWIATQGNENVTAVRANPFRTVWSDSRLRRTFLLWVVTAFALQFGYYGVTTWLPSYLTSDLQIDVRNAGWYAAGTYSMMIAGKFLTGYLADLAGRRMVWVVSGALTALYLPFLIYTATPANAAYLLLIFGFLYGSPYAINSTYMNESFPSGVRGTAVATSYNIGRLGATLSPLMIGYAASNYSIGFGIGLLGIAYGLCAIVPGLFIREKMFDPKSVELEPAPTSRAALSSR